MSGNPLGKPASPQNGLAALHEQRREAENMRNVFYLLDNLFKREEATIKLILDCLYDVGSTNYINQKLSRKPFNRVLKWLARFPKPIFRIVALRWVKKNAPALVARWLHRKVKFVPLAVTPQAVVPDASTVLTTGSGAETAQPAIAPPPVLPTVAPAALEPATAQPAIAASITEPLPAAAMVKFDNYQYEIQRLHSQVNVLATLLVAVTVSLGGAFAWLMWRAEITPAQSVQPIRPAIAQCIDG